MKNKTLCAILILAFIGMLYCLLILKKEQALEVVSLGEKQENQQVAGECSSKQTGLKKISKEQRIQGRLEQELEMTRDPSTKEVPKERLIEARKTTQALLSSRIISGVNWEERGPNIAF